MAASASMRREWGGRGLASFLAGMLLAVLLSEIAVSVVSPGKPRREVEDALRDLRVRDPDVLVISSSHGRSFHVLGEEIARRSAGEVTLVSIPLDAGQIRPMEWVLRNRAAPLLDERDAAGNRVRTRLRHLVFGVTWWDSCRRGSAPAVDHNVISRAWDLNDYLSDVAAHGFTQSNRNFLRYQVQRLERLSRLVQLQGSDALQPLVEKIAAAARSAAPLGAPHIGQGSPAPAISPQLAAWRKDIETGQSCLLFPSERQALERMEAFARERRLEFTVVLFPLMPETVTPAGQLTLDRFSELMRHRGRSFGYRVIDMARLPVLADADFMRDRDHLSAVGNAKFVDWALRHELAFLLVKSPRTDPAPGSGRSP